MGLFSRKTEIRAENVTDSVTPNLSAELLEAYIRGSEISRTNISEIPSVSAAIAIISNIVASLPIKLYSENNGKVTEIEDDKRLKLLNKDTGDTMTSVQFWRAMIADYYLGKGGFAYIKMEPSGIQSIHYIENSEIGILKNSDPIRKDYKITVRGHGYEPFEFLKILRNTKDGMTSIPLHEENPTIMSIAYNSLRFENTLVKKGGNKKGFLTTETQLTKDTMVSLKAAFKNLYSNNTENVVALNKGMDFKESSNTCVEMQLNENKRTNSEEISMIFNMPNSILRGNATQVDRDNFIAYCIVPLLNDIEASLDRDLLTEDEKESVMYFAYDTKELTRGNILERYKAYEVAYQNNFMQIDEIREKEDMQPLGLKFIKLGLDSVLYDPDTKEIYVANTNTSIKMEQMKKGGTEESESGIES